MRKHLRSLSGLDAGFLYLEAAGAPMHVGSVMLLRPPRRRYDFHRALNAHSRERIVRAAPLRRVLQDAPLNLGHPMWNELPTLDPAAHILKRRLPAPGSRTQLWRLIAELHAKVLPRDRPLWHCVVIDGLETGELVLYFKVHHALLDGQGGMALAQALLDVQPTESSRGSSSAKGDVRSSAAPRGCDLATTAIRASAAQFANLVRGLPMTLKLAAGSARDASGLLGRLRDSVLLAPRTLFNVQIGPKRSFAVASLSLDEVKQVARGFGVSLNDVVLALCSDSLRTYLRRRSALPDRGLVAAMPVSLRAAGDAEVNNQVWMVQCVLHTDIADPVERLLAISAATGQLKRQLASFRSLIPTDFPGLAAPIWASGLSRLWARGRFAERLPPLANLAISNVPGPPAPVYLAGAKLLNYFPVSIITHGLGLNITVNSYAGALDFGLIACKDAAPSLEGLAAGLAHALKYLGKNIPA